MPTVYRSNPLSRDIKPMMETMKRGVISEEIKNLRPASIIRPKKNEQRLKEHRLAQQQAKAQPVIIKHEKKPQAPAPRPLPGIYTKPNKAEVLKLVAEGRSYGRIAEILGTTRAAIAGIVYRERHK